MGNYVFNTEFLFEQLRKDAERKGSGRDFGHDIIPAIIKQHNVFAFPFTNPTGSEQAYWRDVGSLDSFWQANMELVSPEPKLDLYDESWPIWTYQEQLAPAKFIFNEEHRRGVAVDSTISGGCIISGSHVRNSLLFSSVHAHSHSVIEESVILPQVDIGQYSKIKRAIIDRGCKIPDNLSIGYDKQQDLANGFRISAKGIVLVTPDMLTALAEKKALQDNTKKDLALA
jgi:glucose-1-phosphate adenylyltransferase